MLKQPFTFGSISLPNNILYAPLAGCSDFPFRRMSAKFGPGLIYCEMVKMDALVRHDPYTYHLLDYDTSMHPIGAQLCGSKLSYAKQSAKILEDLGFDVIDFNCGCPVDKVTKDGSGSGMLKNPLLIGDILSEMVSAVKIPVTVKIRAGWDEESVNGVEITRIAEQAGATAITVHGRTRKQAYNGPANWDWIKECKKAANKILVIGNGDVLDGASAAAMFEQTGCDGVLVARGTMGKPWAVQEIIQYLLGNPQEEKNLEEYRSVLLDHYQEVMNYHTGRGAILDARRIGCWYLKKAPKTREFRDKMSRVETEEEAMELIAHFKFE